MLNPTEFGYVVIVLGVIALIDGLVVMAFNQTLLVLCAKEDDSAKQRKIAVNLAFGLLRMIGILFLCSIPLTLLFAVAFEVGPLVFTPLLLLLYIAAEVVKTSMLAPLTVQKDYLRYSIWIAVEAALGLIIIAAILFKQGDSFAYFVGLVTSRILSTLIFFLTFFKGRFFKVVEELEVPGLRSEAVSYGWPLAAMAPLGWLGGYLDRYILGLLGSAASTGVYSASNGLVGRPFGLTTAILTTYYRPILFQNSHAKQSTTPFLRSLCSWIAGAFVTGIVATLGLVAFGELIASLALAEEYRSDAPVIMIMISCAQTLLIMTHAVDNAVLAKGASSSLLKVQVVLSISTLFIIPLSILWLGFLGAAAGRIAAEAVKFCGTAYLFYNVLNRPSETIE
jgi:O-antigen/teichoic acid export membrane protein